VAPSNAAARAPRRSSERGARAWGIWRIAAQIKAICVVIRGTEVRDKHGKSWLPVDVMADLAAESSNFMGGQAHKGIAMIAEQMLSMHYEVRCRCLLPLAQVCDGDAMALL